MPEFTVQRLGRGYAIVIPGTERDAKGKPKRTRIRLASKDRSSAEAEARSVFGGLSDDPWTVGRIMNEYIAARATAEIASTGRQKDAWKAMRSFWENVDPERIDEAMCRKYAEGRKVGPATLRYELSMLSVALRHANKPKKVWRPGAPERKIRHLTHAEFERWFEQAKAPHARLYALLGLYTMARPTAILELTWDRVDFERKQIDLNPKGRRQTKKRRPVVPLNKEAMEELQTAYKGRQSEYVIERGAKPIGNIKKAFQAASARSGIKVTPYTLRHTGAVWAAEAGASMDELAQYMGHDDSVTTSTHYARYSPGHLRGVATKVQRVKEQAEGFVS
jgi:integrase